jgi:hypothetical protein
MAASSIFVTMHELYRDLPFDVSRDLVPVGFVGQQPMAIAAGFEPGQTKTKTFFVGTSTLLHSTIPSRSGDGTDAARRI